MMMEELRSLPQETTNEWALTIGTFDGVHRGHQHLIAELKAGAHERGLPVAVLTFDDMPFRHFQPDLCSRLLTLPAEKAAAFANLDIERLLMLPFDGSIADLGAQEFVQQILVERLRVKYLLIGPDFALGKNRGGDAPTLRKMGEQFGFEVAVVRDKVTFGGEAISSTRVRGCVEDGHLKTARDLLGRPFSLSGTVVSGDQLGRTIGVPTINFQPAARKVTPSHGVYACHAFFDNQTIRHRAALNIGRRPTVDGTREQIEFHVIDETIETPPQTVRLEVIERLRDEHRFEGLDALKAQLKRDIQKARELLI